MSVCEHELLKQKLSFDSSVIRRFFTVLMFSIMLPSFGNV